jgi:hypothetical protein
MAVHPATRLARVREGMRERRDNRARARADCHAAPMLASDFHDLPPAFITTAASMATACETPEIS